MLSGNWQNNITVEDYLIHMKNIESSIYSHPTGMEHLKEIDKEAKETQKLNKNKGEQKDESIHPKIVN